MTFIQHLGTEHGFPFSFAGAENIVAIMIGNLKGMEILHRIESGMKVTMVIEVGKKHGPWMNQYSIFFISMSFFIVTAATMGYFIFYSARRLRITRAQSRKQVSLCHCSSYPWASVLWILRAKYWLSTRITEFVNSTGRSVRSKIQWCISLNSLKLAKETAKSKLSGESNWSCFVNFVSYQFSSLNCSIVVNAGVSEAVSELNCF